MLGHRLGSLLVAVCTVALTACSATLGQQSVAAKSSSSPSPTPPPIGDACLVGTWTLAIETSQSGYTYNNQPVPVTGLVGARLTLTAAGQEIEVFDGSQPLTGTLPDGRQLAIKIGGSFSFGFRADGYSYTETGTTVQLPTTATVGGAPTPYSSHYDPGSGTYTCSGTSLVMTTVGGGQVDRWAKAS